MKFKNRKLKFGDGETRSIVSLSMPADFIIYAPPLQEAAAPLAKSSSLTTGRGRSQLSKEPSPGFESSMALTIFVLLTALFFMGFFSVYLRCVASGRRSRRAANYISNSRLQQLAAAAAASSSSSDNPTKDDQGLDPITIRSLPILPYNCNYIMRSSTSSINGLEFEDDGGIGIRIGIGENIIKNRDRLVLVADDDKDDCVVCLCEYEEGEMVKVIPNCGHLFHPECIDLWFISHSSCPLCRSTQLFPPSPDQKKHNYQLQLEDQKEADDELMKSTVVLMRRACSFSGGGGSSSSSDYSSSSLLGGGGGGDNIERLKRSSSWSGACSRVAVWH